MHPQEAVTEVPARIETLAEQQRTHLVQLAVYSKLSRQTRSIVALNFYASQFLRMNFWERWRWNLLGQLPEHLSEFAADPEAALLAGGADDAALLSEDSESAP